MSRPHARFRLVCALTLAGVGGLFAAAPAVAAAVPAAVPAAAASASPGAPADALTPLIDCVQDAPLGPVSSRTVVLGYRSTASDPVTVPAGSGENDLTSVLADRGQPTAFAPGEHHGVWLLTVDAAAEPDLGWRLGAGAARFDAAPACTAATAVAVSAPAQVAAGGAASVSAAVTRMLLAAPDAGVVVFTLDDGTSVTAPVSATGVARADLPVSAAGPHTVTAAYQPATGSGLLPAVGTTTLVATAVSAPLSVATDSVVAGSTSVLVTVSRPSPAGVASVDVVTADGTAHAPDDYVAVASTVTLADGEDSATVRVPLAARPAGSPAATFFVLLQRASTSVATASATVSLPPVPTTPAAASTGTGTGGTGATGATGGVSSALPVSDPTAAAPAGTANVGEDLAVLFGGILLTAGGILGVVGLLRAAGLRGAQA